MKIPEEIISEQELKELKKDAVNYWEYATERVDELPWGYIGVVIFLILFGLFIYDTFAGSRFSIWFMIGIIFFIGGMWVLSSMAF